MNRKRPAKYVPAGLLLLAAVSCSQPPPRTAAPNATPLSPLIIGRSTRADVFAALGKPARTERRPAGETWVYETRPSGSRQGLMNGFSAASGLAGAFIPFVGLIGPSLGLYGAATAGGEDANPTSLSISFGRDGIVQDCINAGSAIPAGMPGAPPASAIAAGCQSPSPPPRSRP